MVQEKQNIPIQINKETTLRDAIIGRIHQQINQNGIDEAMDDFDLMDKWFSDLPIWSQITAEVRDIFQAKILELKSKEQSPMGTKKSPK